MREALGQRDLVEKLFGILFEHNEARNSTMTAQPIHYALSQFGQLCLDSAFTSGVLQAQL